MGSAASILDVRVTPVFHWNWGCRSRFVINQGGSRSSKTYSILQALCFRAMEKPGQLITVTAETLPALRKGAMREFEKIIRTAPFSDWVIGQNKSEHTWTFDNGTTIEFVSFPDEDAATHGSRDYLFMNEANHLSLEVANQLMQRTAEQIFIDFNPTSDFWAHSHYMADPEASWFFSTYRDNPFAPVWMVAHIEKYRTQSPEHYKVYGLGRRGNLAGQVFPGVIWVNEWPDYVDDRRYFMDPGHANSHCAFGEIGMADGKIYGREIFYELGLTEPEIVQRLQEHEVSYRQPMIVDKASSGLIDSLYRNYGYNAYGGPKPTIVERLREMRKFTWCVTAESTNWIFEARNYIYPKDKNGGLMAQPIDAHNHLWSGAGYAALDMIGGYELPRFVG